MTGDHLAGFGQGCGVHAEPKELCEPPLRVARGDGVERLLEDCHQRLEKDGRGLAFGIVSALGHGASNALVAATVQRLRYMTLESVAPPSDTP